MQRGDVENTLNATGEVIPAYEQIIISPIRAVIKKVLLTPGTRIEPGQPIVELDKSLTQIEFERYEDQLALKKNSVEQLRMKLDKNLYDAEISDKIKLLNINKLKADLEDTRRLAKVGVVRGSPATRIYTYADVYFPYTAAKSNYQQTEIRGNYIAIILAKDTRDFPTIQSEYKSNIGKIPLPIEANGQKFSEIATSANNYIDDFLDFLPPARSTQGKFMLYAVIGLVVLMFMGLPAINLVNVNVSRMMERASEIGVRKAFGAPSRSLLGQFIIENIFITFIGGAIALVFSFIIIRVINNAGLFAYADLTINFTVFAVSIVVCLIFGFLSGFLPVLRMSKLKIAEALKA